MNDILDVEKDQLHPFKRFRPLANKDLSLRFAFLLALLLASVALTASFFISSHFSC